MGLGVDVMSIARSRLFMATVLLAISVAVLTGTLLFNTTRSGSSNQDKSAPGIVNRLVEGDGAGGVSGVIDARSVSATQAAALADGHVTRTEYQAAIWAAFACMRDAGYEPREEPYPDASRQLLQYSFHSKGDSSQSTVARHCREQHSVLVEMSWAVQNTPSEAQQSAARAAMKQCLVEAGFPAQLVVRATTARELAEYGSPAFGVCATRISGEFGLPGFGF